MSTSPKRVFISYSHDSEMHRKRVRQLADSLKKYGLDARIDTYEPSEPQEGWPIWMERQIEHAESVLLICTETYLRRVRKEELPDVGRGVCWEANLIYGELYASQTCSNKFIPVILEHDDRIYVPKPLGTSNVFLVSDGSNFEYLLRRLLGKANSPAPPVGRVPDLDLPVELPPFTIPGCLPDVNDTRTAQGLRVFGDSADKPQHKSLLTALTEALADGELRDSELGPWVIATIRDEPGLVLHIPFDPAWIKTAIRLSDMYFVKVRSSAGHPDWQRDVAQVITPIIVAIARSLERSADAQATLLRLCDVIAKRLRLSFVWPNNPAALSNLQNSLYRTCLAATTIECDEVFLIVKGIPVQGAV